MDLEHSYLVSILCPPPVNVIITANTFIHFNDSDGRKKVGLVLKVNASQYMISVRLFLTWHDVMEKVGTRTVPHNISFWPNDERYPPYYLCDTDLISDIPVSSVTGLAFVFYETNAMVKEILGMANTYRVTSCVWFQRNLITHGNTFKTFPSDRFSTILLSCFPSMIFSQLQSVKHELQRALNTRSLNSKNSAVVQINNIDMYTWLYMLKDSPAVPLLGSVVTRAGYISFDEYIQKSRKEAQVSLWVGDSNHLEFVQGLFGLAFGIGVRFTVRCRLPKNETSVEVSQSISPYSTLNVVPFEDDCREVVRRGLHFKYRPSSKILSITVRYRRLNGADNFLPHFEARSMVHIHDEGPDIYPFHHDTMVDGCLITRYNLTTRNVELSDGRTLASNDVINILERDIY